MLVVLERDRQTQKTTTTTLAVHACTEGFKILICAYDVTFVYMCNVYIQWQRTALHYASCEDYATIVQVLLEAKADIDAKEEVRR